MFINLQYIQLVFFLIFEKYLFHVKVGLAPRTWNNAVIH